jgi:hypothetical protein
MSRKGEYGLHQTKTGQVARSGALVISVCGSDFGQELAAGVGAVGVHHGDDVVVTAFDSAAGALPTIESRKAIRPPRKGA